MSQSLTPPTGATTQGTAIQQQQQQLLVQSTNLEQKHPSPSKELSANHLIISSKPANSSGASAQPTRFATDSSSLSQNKQVASSQFPIRKRQSNQNNPQQTFISQQLSGMAMKKHQERHRMDQEFAAAATGATNLTSPAIPANSSSSALQQQSTPLPTQQKRSIVDSSQQSVENGKFLPQMPVQQTTTQAVPMIANSMIYPPPAQASTTFSSQVAEQHQVKYSRSFKGTGNQIAALGSPPFINKTHQGGSTLRLLGANQQPSQQQTTPQWIGRMSKPINPNQQQFSEQNRGSNDPVNSSTQIAQQQQPAQEMDENGVTPQRMVVLQNATNSAGRKGRVKSNRKRRFSSSSINQKTVESGGVSSAAQTRGQQLQVQGTKESLGGAAMSQANQQMIIKGGKGSAPQQDAKATIKSTNIGSLSAAYSSVGELNIKSNESTADRFNSRAQNKALNSVQANSNTIQEQLYGHLATQAQIQQQSAQAHDRRINNAAAHYGTNGSSQADPNSSSSNQAKKQQYSQSMTRRNHQGGIQETASGKNLDAESANEQLSQLSNRNFTSLRNSKSFNKKFSATAQKKTKKLKKSESQVRHQQLHKSELTTQKMRLPDDTELGLAATENVGNYPMAGYPQPTPKGTINIQSSAAATGKNSVMNRQDQQQKQRVTNRTPQSFIVNENKVMGGGTSIGPTGTGLRSGGKQADLIKGSTNVSSANANNTMQVQGNNISDLHVNAMHIKKLNFTGRSMQTHATQPVIANQSSGQHYGQSQTKVSGDTLQQLQQALQHQAKELSFNQSQVSKTAGSTATRAINSTDRQQFYNNGQPLNNTANFNQGATSTIESLLKQHSKTGQTSFNEFKSQFVQNSQGQAGANHVQPGGLTGQQKTYKLMKSAERGELNTHNFVMCRHHHNNDFSSSFGAQQSPCTCNNKQPGANPSGGFQSKASQNFQKTFRQGNFVYHGNRRSNDFNTIQSKQSNQLSNGQSPFASGQNTQTFTSQPNVIQDRREDINKFGTNFNVNQAAQQQSQLQAQHANQPLNPMMNDLLTYLQQAYQTQQESIGAASNSKPSQAQAAAQAQAQQKAIATAQAAAAAQQQAAGNNLLPQGQKSNKLIHFEKGDRIIYEPNEMHQLKYINDKGEVSPITGVQYILTQPNFSKGRPCHFFVVNKQEFEAATQGFKLKQEEQKAEELARQKKLQAVANIRSHRQSQKIRNNGTAKSKKMADRKQSAKGARDAAKAAEEKKKEEEKKDEREKYHNEVYTYQKLRSLKWMGGPYRNPHDEAAPIWRPSAEEQELRQQLEAKREIKAKYNLLSLNKQETTELYKYILLMGNNHEVVKRVLDTRPSWTQIKSSQTLYNFKWTPSSRQIKFDFLGKHGQKNLVNHFENHALITTKDQLIDSMSKLCENLHVDVFNSIPTTFIIDLGTSMCQHEFDKFCYYFNMVEKVRDQYLDSPDEAAQQEVLANLNRSIQQHQGLQEKKRKFTSLAMRETLFHGHNMWLFKPADANRGRGVNLFDSIDTLKKLILEHTSRAESKQFQTFAHANNLPVSQTIGQGEPESAAKDGAAAASQPAQPINNTVKSDVFVLQKYIERPLLINKRKFDIRLWVMITAEHKCYLFKEGYIRMSGQNYELGQTENLFVHLTNNAIQKHAQDYGKYEEGNILSFSEGTECLKKQDGIDCDFYKLLREDILPIIEQTMMSVRQKINKNNRKFCMEIFGYDFMIDDKMQPWLIEVNTNPSLEESSTLLRKIIPRMLDDAFKLTLDVMFPPMSAAKIAEAMGEDSDAVPPRQQGPTTFPVPGHKDDENLWGEQPFYILRVPGCVVIQGS